MSRHRKPEHRRGVRSARPLSFDDVERGVLARLRTVTECQPDAVAVLDASGALTFADLAARAGQVAQAVAQTVAQAPREGARREPGQTPVAMLCGHDGTAVATLLGVLLSGHPLLVLDPRTPATRQRGLLGHVRAPVCLFDEEYLALAGETVVGTTSLLVPTPAGPVGTSGGPFTAPAWDAPPDPAGVAALGFTSGSTGRPKVVALNHRHLTGDAWAASTATGCITADDVVAHTLPLAFAAGTNITLAGMLAGATLALYDVRAEGIASLAAWI